MPDRLHFLIVYGSVRQDRQGIRLVRLLKSRVADLGHTVDVADPLELELPMLNKMYKEYEAGTAPEMMQRTVAMIRKADAVIVVSGEYNNGIPPALKNLLDHFLEEWFHRPSAIACYSAGRFGGVRAAMQLRMVLAEIGMPTISSLLPVPNISDAVSTTGEDCTEWLTRDADKFVAELAWWGEAAKRQKAEAGTPF